MIPPPWIAVVLALAGFRVVRLVGWDDLPPVARTRDWLVGARVEVRGSLNGLAGLTAEPTEVVTTYERPLLAHFLGCAFCQGFWVSAAVYVWWLLSPTTCLYGLAPFALSGAVGLIAKNLDP